MMRTILLAWLIPLPVWAAQIQVEQRLEDFDQLVSWIRSDYGPLTFKRTQMGFDLEGTSQEYRRAVSEAGSDDDFKYLLARYVGEFRDAHFRLSYSGPTVANLGFTTDLIQNSVVIDSVNRAVLSPEIFPFERGDVIESWDGHPPLEVARDLSRYISHSYDPTGVRIGVFLLPARKASRVPLPSGPVVLHVRQRTSGAVKAVTLNWIITAPEPTLNTAHAIPTSLNDMCSEISRVRPPASAKVVEGVPFTAFTFDSAQGKIGFLRLPHYYPQNERGEEVAQERFAQYQRVLAEFERSTVGLIVDQDFNCGGSVVFVNKMFSLFQDRPFVPAAFAFRASQDQVTGLRNQLAKFKPGEDGFAELKDVIDEVERTWRQGGEMTRPLPMRGFMEVKVSLPGGNLIEPNPVRYSKPVVLLINELSGSGGDLFPALMKDFGRAKLLGTRTMGAGGHLWDDPPLRLKHSGAQINLTRSLIYRPNGEPIENFGVEPHQNYEITIEDFMDGYANYLNAAVNLFYKPPNN